MNTRIIEVNGVKLELDERSGTVKNVSHYKVGQNVKVLKKEYDSYKSFCGVVVGFDEFPNMPTIVIAYLEPGYKTTEIKFIYLNSSTKDVEICPMNSFEMVINKSLVIDNLDREIAALERQVVEAKQKREYFLDNFGKYFEGGEGKTSEVSEGLHS